MALVSLTAPVLGYNLPPTLKTLKGFYGFDTNITEVYPHVVELEFRLWDGHNEDGDIVGPAELFDWLQVIPLVAAAFPQATKPKICSPTRHQSVLEGIHTHWPEAEVECIDWGSNEALHKYWNCDEDWEDAPSDVDDSEHVI